MIGGEEKNSCYMHFSAFRKIFNFFQKTPFTGGEKIFFLIEYCHNIKELKNMALRTITVGGRINTTHPGFMQVPRDIVNNEYYADVRLLKAWIGLNSCVRFKPTVIDNIRLEVGDALFTKDEIAFLFATDRRGVRTILDRMQKDGYIRWTSIRNKYTFVTVLNPMMTNRADVDEKKNYIVPFSSEEKKNEGKNEKKKEGKTERKNEHPLPRNEEERNSYKKSYENNASDYSFKNRPRTLWKTHQNEPSSIDEEFLRMKAEVPKSTKRRQKNSNSDLCSGVLPSDENNKAENIPPEALEEVKKPEIKYADLGFITNVLLTEDEKNKLMEEFPKKWLFGVAKLDNYLRLHDDIKRDMYCRTISNWCRTGGFG